MPTPPDPPGDAQGAAVPPRPADSFANTIYPPDAEPDFPRTVLPLEAGLGAAYPETLGPEQAGLPVGELPSDGPAAYLLLRELGRGAMGVVYLARHRQLGRLVALKMVLAGTCAGNEELDRFRTEATAIARLAHPAIVAIYDVGEHNGLPYFAMEYCPGGNLASQLDGPPLPPAQAARVMLPLVRAMHHAHERGIVHRDLKPGNVLLQVGDPDHSGTAAPTERSLAVTPLATPVASPDSAATFSLREASARLQPKIADFGLARLVEGGSHTQSGDVLGTPSYMAPEQAAGQVREIGPHTDVWALGAILYECLAGRPPFLGSSGVETLQLVLFREPLSVRALQPKCPRDLETICHKCLQKDPARRYANAAALADDLERFLEGRPIHARPIGPIEQAVRWARRRPSSAALVVLLVVSLAAGVASWGMFTHALGLQRDEASRARHEAELGKQAADENFQQALAAVDRYFTEVSESTLLHEPGVQPLRQALLRNARDFYTRFLAQRGDDPTLQQQLVLSQYRLGLIESEMGNHAGAVKLYDEALQRLARLPAVDASAELRRARAQVLHQRGRALREMDRFADARRSDEDSLAIWAALVKEDAKNLAHLEGQARSHNGLGNVEAKQRRFTVAAEHYREALRLRQRLCAAAPTNEAYQRDLAASWENLASAAESAGARDEAERARTASLKSLRALVTAYPGRALYQEDLARALYNLGNRQLTGGKAGEARLSYLDSIRAFTALAMAHPAVPRYQARLGNAYWNLGLANGQTGQAESAQSYASALYIYESLAQAHPKNEEYQAGLARSVHHQGDLARAANRTAEARKHYDRARGILVRVTDQASANVYYQLLLAQVSNQIGLLQLEAGQLAAAGVSFREALALFDKYAARLSLPQRALAGTCCAHLGDVERRSGQAARALDWYARAAKAADGLRSERALQEASAALARDAAAGRAFALDDLGRFDEAVAAWEAAIQSQSGPELALVRARRLCSQARTARYADAARDAVAAGKKSALGEELFELARAAARAALTAGKDAALEADERERRARAHLDAALGLLKLAAGKGHFATAEGRRRLGGDADLAALRSRAEVKAWLAPKGKE